MIRQSTEALVLWSSQKFTHVMDSTTLVTLTSNPVFVSNENLISIKDDLVIKLYPLDTSICVRLNVADSDNNFRFRILTDENKIVINNRIRITMDGTITFRNMGNNTQRAKLHFICMDVE